MGEKFGTALELARMGNGHPSEILAHRLAAMDVSARTDAGAAVQRLAIELALQEEGVPRDTELQLKGARLASLKARDADAQSRVTQSLRATIPEGGAASALVRTLGEAEMLGRERPKSHLKASQGLPRAGPGRGEDR